MDLMKDLLSIQHELIINKVSDILFTDDLENKQFIEKYNKKNYSIIKVSNCKIRICNCVKIIDLLSNLERDHNSSLIR